MGRNDGCELKGGGGGGSRKKDLIVKLITVVLWSPKYVIQKTEFHIIQNLLNPKSCLIQNPC